MSDSDNSDLSEEDKRFLESDFAKDLLASPDFRRMLENKRRSADIARAAVRGHTLEEQEALDEAHREQAKTVSDAIQPVRSDSSETQLPKQQSSEQSDDKKRTDSADLARSPTMVRFFTDVDRWTDHVRWLKRPLEIWWVLLAIVALAYGGGLAAMFADQYIIALCLLTVTFATLAIRAVSEAKEREKNILIVVLAILFLAAHVGWVLYTHKQFIEKARIGLTESKTPSQSPRDNEPQISVALLPQIVEEPEKEANFEVNGFVVTFHNKSSKIQHDISLILRTPVIRKVTLSDPTRIKLVGGGPSATYMHVVIAELPANGGHLSVTVEVTPTNTLSAQAWKDEYKWPDGIFVYRGHLSDP